MVADEDENSTKEGQHVERFTDPTVLVEAMHVWAQSVVPADERQISWLKSQAKPVEYCAQTKARHKEARKHAQKALKAIDECTKFSDASKTNDPSWGAVDSLRRFVESKELALAIPALRWADQARDFGKRQKWQALVLGLGDPMWRADTGEVEFTGRFKSMEELTAIAVHIGLFQATDANTVIENASTSSGVDGASISQARNYVRTKLKKHITRDRTKGRDR